MCDWRVKSQGGHPIDTNSLGFPNRSWVLDWTDHLVSLHPLERLGSYDFLALRWLEAHGEPMFSSMVKTEKQAN